MLKEISIRKRFYALSSAIFFVMLILSLLIIILVTRLGSVTVTIVDHPLQVSNAASYASVEMHRINNYLGKILNADQLYEIDILEDRILLSETKFYSTLDIIQKDILGDEGQLLEEEARLIAEQWRPIRAQIIYEMRNANPKLASDIYESDGEIIIGELERKLNELNNYARGKASEFEDNAREIEYFIVRLSTYGVGVAFLFVVLSIYWISNNILGSIGSINEQLKGMKDGGKPEPIVFAGVSEFVELSEMFSDLVNDLDTQLWIREGNRQLSSLFDSSASLDIVLNDYVERVASYVGVISCVIYGSMNSLLVLKSSYNRLDFMEDTYHLGYGIFGESAKNLRRQMIQYQDKRILNVDSIPFDNILIEPVEVDGRVLGVIGFVFDGTLSDEKESLILQAIRDLAVYWDGKKQRAQIDELLTKSIRNNELLVHQKKALEENKQELTSMNNELEEQRNLLKIKSKELVRQNLELEELRKELEDRYNNLESSAEYKAQFLSNVSHELRTPLNSIILLSTLLHENTDSTFRNEDLNKINVILVAAKNLLSIINGILDLAKLEKGMVEVIDEVFDGQGLVEELSLLYKPMAEDKELDFAMNPHEPFMLFGDKEKVRHILTNFLSNALKFTENGRVELNFAVTDRDDYPIVYEVKDTGIGIEKSKLEIIFQEFVQSEDDTTRKYGGTGLGLSISKNYADLIGGKIEVDSTPGIGSRFRLILPHTFLSYNDGSDIKGLLDNIAQDNIMLESDSELVGMKVLICDDEIINVFAISAIIENMGLEPVTALSGDEAIRVAENEAIDLILMDYMMPGTNGYETIETIRCIKGYDACPCFIITAADLPDAVLSKITHAGIKLMKKPISAEILTDSIVNALTNK